MSWHQYFFLWPCMGWAPPSLFQGGPSIATRIPRWSTKEDGGSSGETSCLLLTCTLNLLDQFCSGEKGRGLGVAPISNPNTFSWSSASPKAERNQCVYVSILILSLSRLLTFSRPPSLLGSIKTPTPTSDCATEHKPSAYICIQSGKKNKNTVRLLHSMAIAKGAQPDVIRQPLRKVISRTPAQRKRWW